MIRGLMLLPITIALTISTVSSTQAKLDGLTVHEWGTFTSIAGADGAAVEWTPQAGRFDLPCFVHRKSFNVKRWMPGTVRMETPVLYFYATRPTSVDVRVRFRQGAISEWFPDASVSPSSVGPADLRREAFQSSIVWRNVSIIPTAAPQFPFESSESHYYAARSTDAAPLESGAQKERFLFYRGVGSFAPPLTAVVGPEGTVTVANSAGEPIGDVMLFENRGGFMSYDFLPGAASSTTLRSMPIGDESPTPLAALEELLTDHGLFAKEAKAMIETWRDSWFEEGARVFYFAPRRTVDTILPLEVVPEPTRVERVFVGRIELVTPAIEAEVRDAIAHNDGRVLQKYGRFIEPILARVLPASTPAERMRAENLMSPIRTAWVASASCR
jgi:hypothetical protein